MKGLPARTYTWGQTMISMGLQYKHLGITVTLDGWPDAHTKQVITQGNVRVLQMGKLLRDEHLSVRVKRMLVQSALCLLLEYGAEVLDRVKLTPLHSMLECKKVCSLRLPA